MAVKQGRYGGRSAAERKDERRARLIEATLEVWASDDAKITMTRVCATAGLTERYFYESFESLDQALEAVLEHAADRILMAAAVAGETTPGGPVQRVRAAVGSLLDVLQEDPRLGRAVFIRAAAMPGLRSRRIDLLDHFSRFAVEEAEAYFSDRRSDHGDALTARLFIGGLHELVLAWLDAPTVVRPDDVIETATAAFVRLFAPVGDDLL